MHRGLAEQLTHAALGDAEHPTDLLLRAIVLVVERQHLLETLGEAPDLGGEAGAEFGGVVRLARIDERRLDLIGIDLAEAPERRTAGDVDQPLLVLLERDAELLGDALGLGAVPSSVSSVRMVRATVVARWRP